MVGYSGTPLLKKIGIKPGHTVALVNAPDGFKRELGEVPGDVRFVSESTNNLNVAMLFSDSKAALQRALVPLTRKIVADGMIWIAWPKKSSGVVTDLSENVVREVGLSTGMVEIKVCAVTDVWSGLKFVYRVADRARVSEARTGN